MSGKDSNKYTEEAQAKGVRPLRGGQGRRIARDTPFVPTEKMKAFAQEVFDPQETMSTRAICRRAKVARQSYYDWLKDPRFCQWLQNVTDRARAAALPRVWATIEYDAIVGPGKNSARISAQRLFLERFDPGFKSKDTGPIIPIQFVISPSARPGSGRRDEDHYPFRYPGGAGGSGGSGKTACAWS